MKENLECQDFYQTKLTLKAVTKGKEEHYIRILGSIHQEYITTVISVYLVEEHVNI